VVAQRRFGPVIAVLFVGLAIVVARLFQVQVLEHEVWAQQAAGLVRSSKVLPSHRGSLLDRNGRVLVRDEDLYQIEFRYRDFRRGHPLGMLAHARSTLEMRAVPLVEALDHHEAWTRELLALSPALLDAFVKGQAVSLGSLRFEATAEGPELDAQIRSRRATDVRYYVGQLLGITTREQRYLRLLPEEERGRSYVDLMATHRFLRPDDLLERTLARVDDSCRNLEELAGLLESDRRASRPGSAPFAGSAGSADAHELAGGAATRDGALRGADLVGADGVSTWTRGARAGAFAELLDLLESVRADVEDDSADELFRLAAGFEAGDVDTETLHESFDLAWIARLLRWNPSRLDAWIATRRPMRQRTLDRVLLPRILAQTALTPERERAERFLDELAYLWAADGERDDDGAPPSWRDLDDLVVLTELPTLFADTRLPRGVSVPEMVLPFQDDQFADPPADLDDPWRFLGLVSDLAGKDESGELEPLREPFATEFWTRVGRSAGDLESPEALEEARRLAHALDRRHASATNKILSRLVSARVADGLSPRLSFSEERLRRAENQEKYVQIDRGDRPLRLFAEPSYTLVQRIGRHPELYRGFTVRETTRRTQVARDADGEPVAGLLLGGVRKPMLREVLRQSRDERRLAELRFMTIRSAAEDAELRDLAARVQGADEWTGSFGLEDYLDPELRGKPGWLQTEGLEEHARDDAGSVVQAPTDGSDVTLTLDATLQATAQQVLAHPIPPNDRTDRLWFEHPVGAIVLLTPDGDVLTAASVPMQDGLPPTPGRGRERSSRSERTLLRPTFNPPGSVFKPFVAAYALDRLGFDPHHEFACRDNGKGSGGFETMRCLGIHVKSDLRRALTVSCNAYFAQLGLEYQPQQLLDMSHTFGFDEPTGIRFLSGKGRSGLREDWAFARSDEDTLGILAGRSARLQFANGLNAIEATPMQVARATCGLVTGRLPDVRLVDRIGERLVPRVSRDLGIGESSLEFVRSAMRNVVESGEGSAHDRRLSPSDLGFSFACKTGSADYKPFQAGPDLTPDDEAAMRAGKVRKHTWIAGWFPAEAPVAVIVVYLHDVSDTSSHTAVWVTQQFLSTPEVRKFVESACAEAAK